MSVDFLINPNTNDLGYKNGRLLYAVSGNEIAQRVITRIRRLKGEWFTNVSVGMPYIQEILGKKDINFFSLRLRREILQTEGVESIRSFNLSFDSKKDVVSVFVEIKVNGEYIPISQELNI